MRHTVHLLVDEMAAAVAATARLLDATPLRVKELTLAPGTGSGPGRLTAVIEAPPGTPVAELFARAAAACGLRGPVAPREAAPVVRVIAPNESRPPFHWQADGAGDDRVA